MSAGVRGILKVSKSMLFVLGIGVVVIALIYLVFAYRSQAGDRDSLSQQIAADTQTAANLDVQKLSLQTQKTQLSAQYTEAKTAFDQAGAVYSLPLESIDYGQELFNTADTLQVQITNLSMSRPSITNIDNLNYRVMDINLDVQGSLDGITGFTNTLADSSSFGGISIGNVSISQMNSSNGEPRLHISLRAYQITGE
jgi:hypothetical protein